MIRSLTVLTFVLLSFQLAIPESSLAAGKHLFILSGQSNMAGLDPTASFTPAVVKEFGQENVIVVKYARGGQPIRRWYKNWKSATGVPGKNNGDLYVALMRHVNQARADHEIESVTFVWMQGERDAKTKEVSVYGDSLKGLVKQLQADLDYESINVVVGRLGIGQLKGKPWSDDWAALRQVQEGLCRANKRWELVDCDDLEMKDDQLHFTPNGYRGMGERFAAKAIGLIRGAE